jgi:tripartite-type tricarboxylate transporter receptor subunit TctC
MRNRGLLAARCALAVCIALYASMAQAWPDRLVKIVVPAPAGGNIDVIARVYAESLSQETGQPVIIENRAGAGGSIGTQAMLSAPQDGHTIMITNSNVLTETPYVIKPPYDPVAGVKPVAAIARFPVILVGSPSFTAPDMASLLASLKSSPGKGKFASPSPGTLAHYGGEMLNQRLSMDMTHVPYSGSPAALMAVMSGEVSMYFDGVVTSAPYVRAGKVKPFGIAGTSRFAALPQVPTFTEQGFPEFADFFNWMGIIVSPKVPAEVVKQIYEVSARIAANAKFQAKVVDLGFESTVPASPDEFGRILLSDYTRNGNLVRKLNIKP